MLKLRQSIPAIILTVLMGIPSIASAAPPVYQGPFLDPHTNSYFELRVDNGRNHKKPHWKTAYSRAARLSYQGRRGRLAIVNDTKTLEFIRKKFEFREEAWIGLRFYCKVRKLIWVNGQPEPLHNRRLWHAQWYRNPLIKCGKLTTGHYMPVYLTSEASGQAYWQASGPSKFFVSYLVEYPAPPPADKEAATNKPQ